MAVNDITYEIYPIIPHYDLVNLYGCSFGKDVKIGAFVEIQRGAKIGSRVKISSHTFICEGVTIEDDVFIGHNVNFINDKRPKASDGSRLITDGWDLEKTLVKRGASIGTGSTIMCGVTIGEGALVGANSLVTKNVGDYELWFGSPAKYQGNVNKR